jgi:hypothetical protein
MERGHRVRTYESKAPRTQASRDEILSTEMQQKEIFEKRTGFKILVHLSSDTFSNQCHEEKPAN